MLEEAESLRTTDFVSELQRQGVTLWIDGEQLRVRAPQGTLSSSLRAALAEKKAELMQFLRARQAALTITPDPKTRYAPFLLTELQQSYWLGQTDAFELGNVSPHVYSELSFSGVDLDRIRAVVRKLIERHDMLRAVVLSTGEQVVLERAPDWEFPCLDLTGWDEQARSSELARVRDDMSRNFKPSDTWPLFDLRAHLLPEGELRLHVSISLLAIDGTSLRILADEARALYEEPERDLPAPPVTFRDYVVSAAAFRETPAYQRQEQYWRERLAEMPPAPELPLARAPASITRPVLKRRSARFDADTWAGFQKFAGTTGVFRTSALCAAYCAVLGRWSKKPSFTLNILDSQRPALQDVVSSVVGNFSATTLTTVDAASSLTFAELARQVNGRRLLDRQNGAVSGVWALRELNRLRGSASQASMPVVFNSLDSVLEGDEDVFANEVFGSLQTPQMMLDHMVVARGRGLELHWDALEEVFPEGVLDSMFDAYRRLVARLSTDGAAWQLPLHELVEVKAAPRLGDRREPRQARLCDDIWKRGEERPGATAVVDGTRTLTYRELLGEASGVARWLHERKAERGGLIAVVMNKGWEQLVAVLGIHEAGGAYLPIDAQLPGERIRQLLARGNVRLVVTQPWLEHQIAWPESVECLSVAAESMRDSSLPGRLGLSAEASDLAYVIFTSGSTGEPKGVMIDHLGALNTIDDINERFGVTAADRVLAVSSLGFDLSVYDVFGLLGAGGTVVVPGSDDARDPERLAGWLRDEGVTIWNSVPATMEVLVEHLESRGERLPPPLRVVLLSGDWIPVTLPDRIRRLGDHVKVVSLGGATEASIWSIAYPIERVDPEWKSIPYGAPLTNQRIDVLNDALEPCPTWVSGELYIAGVGLALGYFGDPSQTKARFVRHPRSGERLYRTGDWGRYLPDGNIEFLGRDDLQVKIQGFRIELGEIETVLTRHGDVRAAVVSVVSAGANGRQLSAHVVPKHAGLTVADVRAFLAERLPAYMVPAFITLLPGLPLTSNGKVDRKRLPEPELLRSASQSAPPSSPREVELASLWEVVLQRQGIGVSDNFFELGGNSLSAVRLSALIEQKLGRRIAVSQLLRAPTIAGMAELLGSAPESALPCLVHLRERPSRRPLLLVHPVGGNVFCYRLLAELLPEYSLYGIQASEGSSDISIEEMARRYLQEVRASALRGPWLVGGWSMGGILAAEMAAQLAASGEHVEAVVMLDSLVPPGGLELGDAWLVERFLADLGAPADLCRRGAEWTTSSGPKTALERALPELDAGGAGVERLTALFGLFARNQRALRRHVPKPSPAPVLLVRARERVFEGWLDPAPWLRATGARVSEHTVDASHFTLLREPAVEPLAKAVAAFLGEVSERAAAPAAQESST